MLASQPQVCKRAGHPGRRARRRAQERPRTGRQGRSGQPEPGGPGGFCRGRAAPRRGAALPRPARRGHRAPAAGCACAGWHARAARQRRPPVAWHAHKLQAQRPLSASWRAVPASGVAPQRELTEGSVAWVVLQRLRRSFACIASCTCPHGCRGLLLHLSRHVTTPQVCSPTEICSMSSGSQGRVANSHPIASPNPQI